LRFGSTTAALIASTGLLAAGCAHDRMAWPPTATDIQRINEAAQDNHWLRVEYVSPIPSPNLRVGRPTGIASVDNDEIGFLVADGETSKLPARLVTGVTVKDRGRGTLIGASIGTAAAIVELAAWFWVKSDWDRRGGCGSPAVDLSGDICETSTYIGFGAVMILTGAALGYLIGSRRTFDFGPDR